MDKKDKISEKQKKTKVEKKENVKTSKRLITKKDIIYMSIITLIYTIVSFINFGSFTNPQTFWQFTTKRNSAIIELPDNTYVSKIKYYTGVKSESFTLSSSDDNVNYENSLILNADSVFHWFETTANKTYKYIKISGQTVNTYLGEIAFFDKENNLITVKPLNENAKLITDEQNTIPEKISFLNSTYFDEVYFPRTAYEHLHDLDIYEWTHPPLGKLIMAIPIIFLGITPFSYRLMGNIAGILMIPVMYVFAKMLFKRSRYGILAGSLMALDGMHFVQTRIGTVDSFLVLFILLSYMFMYKYIINTNARLRKRLFCLLLSGIFIGMSIAVKWTGLFAGLGLAIIFFISFIIEIVKKRKFTKDKFIILLSCILFFIIIPITIYLASYIPFFTSEHKPIPNTASFINWQEKMYEYHHDLKSNHTYSSKWYTWPFTQKSILYSTGTADNNKITRIALLGNPAIFWISVPCMISLVILAISKRKFKYLFLIIAILSLYCPYIGIPRIMFLYHYFPVLPFAMLSIVAFAEFVSEIIPLKNFSFYFIGLILLVSLIFFVMFYPVYSGFPVPSEYLKNLKWLHGWVW